MYSEAKLEEIEAKVEAKMNRLKSKTPSSHKAILTEKNIFKEFIQEEKEENLLSSTFESFCHLAYKYINFIKLSKKNSKSMADNIEVADLKITPNQVVAASIMLTVFALFLALIFFVIGFRDGSFFTIGLGLFLTMVCLTYPKFLADVTRMRTQQEAVMAMNYITIYMRVNPVLENAIFYSSRHLHGLLGKELKVALWLLDLEKTDTIEESLDLFVPLWIKRDPDFVKSLLILHTVKKQKSKVEQEAILDKSMNMLLDTTYIKMKHYTHELKDPVIFLHTFGMVMPLIALIMFPIVSVFLSGAIKTSYLFFGYVVVLPGLLFFIMRRILSKRPGAFSAPDLSNYKYLPPYGIFSFKFKNQTYKVKVLNVALIVGGLITLPGIFFFIFSTIPAMIESAATSTPAVSQYTFGAMMYCLTIPLGVAIGIIIYFLGVSIQRLKVRKKIMEIENNLEESLFQLNNHFTQNIPLEIAIEEFLKEFELLKLKKKSIFQFFYEVYERMQEQSLTFEKAALDDKNGVILSYPSVLLKQIIWILLEGSRKGFTIIHKVLAKISAYLANLKRIKELIYDLLIDTVSTINLQAKFLAPILASIVGSMTLIIVRAFSTMTQKMEEISSMFGTGGGMSTGADAMLDFVDFAKVVPPTLFQIMVGFFLIETVILLSMLASGVKNGFDKIDRNITISRNLAIAMTIYIVALIAGIVLLGDLERAIATTTA